jgi:MFS family permease
LAEQILAPAAQKSARDVTFYFERLRAIASGINDSADQTFVMLIATQALMANNTEQSLIASGARVGQLISPLIVLVAQRSGKPSNKIASIMFLMASISFGVSIFNSSLSVFVPTTVTALALASLLAPLTTQIYQDNYPPHERGKLFSRTFIIRILASITFGALAGILLDHDLANYHLVLAVFAIGAAFSAWCMWRVPSKPLARSRSINPLSAMRYLRTDRTFLLIQSSWMLLGIAWSMVIPLRVEYLSNPKYGITLSPREIALFVSVIPDVTRLLMTPIWGWVFDKLSFFALRIATIFAFSISIVAFFLGSDVVGLVLAAVALGFGTSGGDLAWNLWATKLAAPERVVDYMAVHTFFTGVRAVIVPLIAFQLVQVMPITSLGTAAAIIMAMAGLMLVPEYIMRRRANLPL